MEITNTDLQNLSVWIASQNDELKRLRAFAREILDRDSKRDIENCELELMGIKHGLIDRRGDLVGFLKAAA